MNTLTISLTLNFVFLAKYAIQSYRNYLFKKEYEKYMKMLKEISKELDRREQEKNK